MARNSSVYNHTIHIWTDGSCINNGKPDSYGGWAALMMVKLPDGCIHRKEYTGGWADTTNSQMELEAVIGGLSRLRKRSKVVVHSDSKYVIDNVNYVTRWKRNGWKTRSGSPVKNIEQWKAIDELVRRHQVEFRWTKGHAGDKYNKYVDRLARSVADEYRPSCRAG